MSQAKREDTKSAKKTKNTKNTKNTTTQSSSQAQAQGDETMSTFNEAEVTARLKKQWLELFRLRMKTFIEKQWLSHVESDDYSDHGGFLYSILKEVDWFDCKIDSAQLLVLFHVEVAVPEKGAYEDVNVTRPEPDVIAWITPYLSVEGEEDSSSSVDWERFTPCDGGVTHTTNSNWQ